MNPGRRLQTSGFTLIELLVVIVIVGVLSAIAVPTMVNQTRRSRVAEAQANLDGLRVTSELYRMDFGRYPSSYADVAAGGINANLYADSPWSDTAPNYQEPECDDCTINGALWSTTSHGGAYINGVGEALLCQLGLGAAAGSEDHSIRSGCNL